MPPRPSIPGKFLASLYLLGSFLLITLHPFRILAQTDFLRLKSFGNPALSAATPCASPLEGTNGNLYGTTTDGGANDLGTVYKGAKDGTGLTILHSFTGNSTDGANPMGGLAQGSDGALYGTTFAGGSNNLGTLFRLNQDGSAFVVLKHFSNNGEGARPQAALLKASDGNLFGTTSSTLFKLDPQSIGFSVLHSFGATGDGNQVQAGPIEGSDGFLYGTTVSGGVSNLGTIFKLNKDGSNYALLFSFSGTNGRNPQAGLFEASDGLLYGTSAYRSTNSYGTVFSITKAGTNLTVLHTFYGTNGDGWGPVSALIEGADGHLWGTTTNGGLEGQGTIFNLSKDGSLYSIIHNFSWTNDDGRVPLSGLVKASDGLLYGTASRGGAADYGTVFRIGQTGAAFAMLATFSWSGYDGWNCQANLTEASDGALYGTTFNGGSNDCGTVFKMNKDRTGYSIIHNFTLKSDGGFPRGAVVEGTNGALYGTALEGGTNSYGAIFRLNKDGSGFSVLHHFSAFNGNGGHPQAALLLGSNGVFYGTTLRGGNRGWRTIFKLNHDGANYAVIRSIDTANQFEIEPLAGLIEGSDGFLYGTASGGSANSGTIFKIAKDGSGFTNLHVFTNASASDGRGIYAGLLKGTNGNLFGTTFFGGGSSLSTGVVYSVTQDGLAFSVIHTFSGIPDGRNPSAALVGGNNGELYGVTLTNRSPLGVTNWGTVFSLGYDGGGYRMLKAFTAKADGRNPLASLTLASDGSLYGTTSAGGDMNAGVIFGLAQPPVISDISMSASGALLRLQGTSSRSYNVQSTTNILQPNWIFLGPAIWTNGFFEFTDSAAGLSEAKFYRAQER